MSDILDLKGSVSHSKPTSKRGVSVGFSSSAEDIINATLDLNRELINNPASTFYARVSGESMSREEIHDGDLIIIDKMVEPYDGCVAVCYLDGDFTLRRVKLEDKFALLISGDGDHQPIKVDEHSDFKIWGVVRYCIKKF